MLSPKERRFASSPNSFSSAYRRVLRARIRKKIEKAVSDVLLCLENQDSMDANTLLAAHRFIDVTCQKKGKDDTNPPKEEDIQKHSIKPGIADDGEPEF